MPPRWKWIGVIALAGIATPRLAAARTEISARVPVDVAFGDGTRFELGLRSDLLYLFDLTNASVGLGIAGEVRSIDFSTRAQEVGVAFAALDSIQRGSHMGFVLDSGFGAASERRYVYSRVAYQFRLRLPNDDRGFAYALGGGIFAGARATVSGPGAWEGFAGVEIGGGLLAVLWRGLASMLRG